MLEIKKVNNENIQGVKAYIKKNNISYDVENRLAMCIVDSEIIGLGGFLFDGENCFLDMLHTEEGLDYGLAKALLNMADLRGIKKVYCNNEVLYKLGKRLGFKEDVLKNEACLRLDLEGYFNEKC